MKRHCQCCGQLAMEYDYGFSVLNLDELILWEALFGAEPGNLKESRWDSNLRKVGTKMALRNCVYWGLLRVLPKSHYQLTEEGLEFLENKRTVPDRVVVFNGEVIEQSHVWLSREDVVRKTRSPKVRPWRGLTQLV